MDTCSPALQPVSAQDQAHGCGPAQRSWAQQQTAQAMLAKTTSLDIQHAATQLHGQQQQLPASSTNDSGPAMPQAASKHHAMDVLTPNHSGTHHHHDTTTRHASDSPPPLTGSSTSVPGAFSGAFRRYAGQGDTAHQGSSSEVGGVTLGTTPATQLTGISASGGAVASVGPKPGSAKTRPAASSAHPASTLHGTPTTAPPPPGMTSKPAPGVPLSSTPAYPQPAPELNHTPQQRRALTKPSEGTKNDGYDNDNCDLILRVGDLLLNHNPTHGICRKYTIQSMLGQGTFGQVVSCWSDEMQQNVAVKVIKNQPAYFHQARVEIGLLSLLNTRCDPNDERHIVRMIDSFLFRKHLCIVFEKLDVNLFELLKRNAFKGLSLPTVQSLLRQLLDALTVLRDNSIMHCDLKPENILLKSMGSDEIKLIDFGSACFENRVVYSYIQSRFYRSPEVVLGTSYNVAIDMWSLGCVAAELFLGLPLFPGASEHDLMMRIVESLGLPPTWLLQEAKHTERYFRRVNLVAGSGPQLPLHSPSLLASSLSSGGLGPYDLASSVPRHQHQHLAQLALQQHVSGSAVAAGQGSGGAAPGYTWVLLSQSEFESRNNCKAPAGKRYFQHKQLADIIAAYPMRPGLQDEEISRERLSREAFIDFLLGVLDLDPRTRWTPRQAAAHPFINGAPFTGPFQPPPDVRMSMPMLPPHHPQPSPVRSSSESVPGPLSSSSQPHAAVPIPPQVVTGFNAPSMTGNSMAQPSLPSSLQTSFIMGTPHKRAAVARGSPTLRQQQQQQQAQPQGSGGQAGTSLAGRSSTRSWHGSFAAGPVGPGGQHTSATQLHTTPPAAVMKSPQQPAAAAQHPGGWAAAGAGGGGNRGGDAVQHQQQASPQQLQGGGHHQQQQQQQMVGVGGLQGHASDLALSQQLSQLNQTMLLGNDAVQMAAQMTARALARAALQQLPQQVTQNLPFMSPGVLSGNMPYLGSSVGAPDMQMLVDSGSGFNRGMNGGGSLPLGGAGSGQVPVTAAAAQAQAQALANMLLGSSHITGQQQQTGWPSSRPVAAPQQQQQQLSGGAVPLQQSNWAQGVLGATGITAADMQNMAAMAAMAAVRQAAAQLSQQGQGLGLGLTPQQLALLRQQQQAALVQAVSSAAMQALPPGLQGAGSGFPGNGATAGMWGVHSSGAWDPQQPSQQLGGSVQGHGTPGQQQQPGGLQLHGHAASDIVMTQPTGHQQATSSHQAMPLSRPSSSALADGESPAPYTSGGGAGTDANGSQANSAAQRAGGGASPAEWDPLYAEFEVEEGESAMSPRDSMASGGRAGQHSGGKAAGRRASSGQDSGMRGGSSGGGGMVVRASGPSIINPSITDIARGAFGGVDVPLGGLLSGQPPQPGAGMMLNNQGLLFQAGAVPMDVSSAGEQQQHGGIFTWGHTQLSQGVPVTGLGHAAVGHQQHVPPEQFMLGSLPFSGMGAGPGMHTYQMLRQQQQQQQQQQQFQMGGGQGQNAGDASGSRAPT